MDALVLAVFELGVQEEYIDILAAGEQLGMVMEGFHNAVIVIKHILFIQQMLLADGLDSLCRTNIVIDAPAAQKRELEKHLSSVLCLDGFGFL